ncbi:MAG TPA: hypothetical protein VMF67_02085 [Rhizomicrobium sp.]|nr:hypothetical protein [Rhizomicrobium sp.]
MLRTESAGLCVGAVLWAIVVSGGANASMGSLAPRSPGTSATARQEWVADPRTNCRALDADFDPGDSIRWQGICVAGMVSGPGTLSFLNNGRVLETIAGTFGEGALLPGRVSAVWSDGSKYEGGQSGGQFEGMGNFLSATGDKIDGEWKGGALSGKATVVWSNGDRYDGDWKDGKSDGEGTEVWANGDRFEGLWKDGAPVRQNGTAQNGASNTSVVAMSPAAPVVPASRLPGADGSLAAPQVLPVAATPQDAPIQGITTAVPLHDLVGKTLIAVDGSTIDLGQSEGGLTRVVILPSGVTQQTSFAFMNDRIGTVSSETSAIGLFRVNGDEIDTNYVDGKTEVMKPVAAGGLLLTSRSPDGSSACTAWYPEGHVFSQDEKKAAVEEYASRLGINESSPPKKHRAARADAPTCGGGFVTSIAAAGSPTPLAPSARSVPTEKAAPGNGTPPDGLQAIPVKDSTVHLIDAPYEPATAPKAFQDIKFGSDATIPQAPLPAQTAPSPGAHPLSNASQCLSVTSDGNYWGFQNRCAMAVQFAYCEMSDANPLTSCHRTSVSGSVAANGFSALINDTSLSEQGIKHEFRWMACDGGAGEVVPHLDSVDPPSGRCLRAVPASSGANPNPAGS